ncbi:MAG: ATP-binding cassette domain-containing protein, partial [Pseudomonadales bacterium]|nr:ATP-binding cassette domain-containing protein [Pseudomonadales bacterium]
MAIIELEDVHKSFVKARELVEVLLGIDLTVDEGDFVALMGPSGSGKTTLLNIIGGLDSASAGQVVVAGNDLDALSNRDLAPWRAATIGFVFQFYNLLPVLNAQRNVEL